VIIQRLLAAFLRFTRKGLDGGGPPLAWTHGGLRDVPVVAALVIGGVLLLGMVAVAGYAVRALPAGASVPLHAGAPEYSVWLAKRTGLAAWLGIGAAAFAVFAGLTTSTVAGNWASSVRVVLLPSVMCVVLAAEAAAVISARQRGRAGEPAPDEVPAGEVPADEPAPDEAPAGALPPEPATPGTEPATAENQ
jgi:hypothetical protein